MEAFTSQLTSKSENPPDCQPRAPRGKVKTLCSCGCKEMLPIAQHHKKNALSATAVTFTPHTADNQKSDGAVVLDTTSTSTLRDKSGVMKKGSNSVKPAGTTQQPKKKKNANSSNTNAINSNDANSTSKKDSSNTETTMHGNNNTSKKNGKNDVKKDMKPTTPAVVEVDSRLEQVGQVVSDFSAGFSEGLPTRTLELLKGLSKGMACPICLDPISVEEQVWNCSHCYDITHHQCIIRWANQKKIAERNRTFDETVSSYRDEIHRQGQVQIRNGPRSTNLDQADHVDELLAMGNVRGAVAAATDEEGSLLLENEVVYESADASFFCPSCMFNHTEVALPTCYCGKAPMPTYAPGVLPHSCGGNTCGKQRFVSNYNNAVEEIEAAKEKFESMGVKTVFSMYPYNCPHPCVLNCHPGPCVTCTSFATNIPCACGSSTVTVSCAQVPNILSAAAKDVWSDGAKKAHLLSCLKPCGKKYTIQGDSKQPLQLSSMNGKYIPITCTHTCPLGCHYGNCPACTAVVPAICRCGKHTDDKRACGAYGQVSMQEFQQYYPEMDITKYVWNNAYVRVYQCRKQCDLLLACDAHKCAQPCHAGPCTVCTLIPKSEIDSCSCGKKTFHYTLDSPNPRNKCSDKKASCGAICNHACTSASTFQGVITLTSCSHPCDRVCGHDGMCQCTTDVEVPCRCGKQDLTVSCRLKSIVETIGKTDILNLTIAKKHLFYVEMSKHNTGSFDSQNMSTSQTIWCLTDLDANAAFGQGWFILSSQGHFVFGDFVLALTMGFVDKDGKNSRGKPTACATITINGKTMDNPYSSVSRQQLSGFTRLFHTTLGLCVKRCKRVLTCDSHQCFTFCCPAPTHPHASNTYHSCNMSCMHVLPCGHACSSICHKGACPPCQLLVPTAHCPCGNCTSGTIKNVQKLKCTGTNVLPVSSSCSSNCLKGMANAKLQSYVFTHAQARAKTMLNGTNNAPPQFVPYSNDLFFSPEFIFPHIVSLVNNTDVNIPSPQEIQGIHLVSPKYLFPDPQVVKSVLSTCKSMPAFLSRSPITQQSPLLPKTILASYIYIQVKLAFYHLLVVDGSKGLQSILHYAQSDDNHMVLDTSNRSVDHKDLPMDVFDRAYFPKATLVILLHCVWCRLRQNPVKVRTSNEIAVYVGNILPSLHLVHANVTYTLADKLTKKKGGNSAFYPPLPALPFLPHPSDKVQPNNLYLYSYPSPIHVKHEDTMVPVFLPPANATNLVPLFPAVRLIPTKGYVCPHDCAVKCHKDCGVCMQTSRRLCCCQNVILTNVICSTSNPTCGGVCNKLLECNRHRCARQCHPGKCGDGGNSHSNTNDNNTHNTSNNHIQQYLPNTYTNEEKQHTEENITIIASQTTFQNPAETSHLVETWFDNSCRHACGRNRGCGHLCSTRCHYMKPMTDADLALDTFTNKFKYQDKILQKLYGIVPVYKMVSPTTLHVSKEDIVVTEDSRVLVNTIVLTHRDVVEPAPADHTSVISNTEEAPKSEHEELITSHEVTSLSPPMLVTPPVVTTITTSTNVTTSIAIHSDILLHDIPAAYKTQLHKIFGSCTCQRFTEFQSIPFVTRCKTCIDTCITMLNSKNVSLHSLIAAFYVHVDGSTLALGIDVSVLVQLLFPEKLEFTIFTVDHPYAKLLAYIGTNGISNSSDTLATRFISTLAPHLGTFPNQISYLMNILTTVSKHYQSITTVLPAVLSTCSIFPCGEKQNKPCYCGRTENPSVCGTDVTTHASILKALLYFQVGKQEHQVLPDSTHLPAILYGFTGIDTQPLILQPMLHAPLAIDSSLVEDVPSVHILPLSTVERWLTVSSCDKQCKRQLIIHRIARVLNAGLENKPQVAMLTSYANAILRGADTTSEQAQFSLSIYSDLENSISSPTIHPTDTKLGVLVPYSASALEQIQFTKQQAIIPQIESLCLSMLTRHQSHQVTVPLSVPVRAMYHAVCKSFNIDSKTSRTDSNASNKTMVLSLTPSSVAPLYKLSEAIELYVYTRRVIEVVVDKQGGYTDNRDVLSALLHASKVKIDEQAKLEEQERTQDQIKQDIQARIEKEEVQPEAVYNSLTQDTTNDKKKNSWSSLDDEEEEQEVPVQPEPSLSTEPSTKEEEPTPESWEE